MVHALVNVFGLSLTAASLAYRHTGRRRLARGLSGLGFLTSATAAHLGGKLSFALGIRVNRTVGQTVPRSFVPVLDVADLQGDELHRVDVADVPVLLARSQRGELCALANTCTHLGGPLAEGSRVGAFPALRVRSCLSSPTSRLPSVRTDDATVFQARPDPLVGSERRDVVADWDLIGARR